jgi:hypothetical protein
MGMPATSTDYSRGFRPGLVLAAQISLNCRRSRPREGQATPLLRPTARFLRIPSESSDAVAHCIGMGPASLSSELSGSASELAALPP